MLSADRASHPAEPPASRSTWIVAVVVAAVVAAGVVWWVRNASGPTPEPAAPTTGAPAPAPLESGPRHPIESVRSPVEPIRPLPSLDASDAALRPALAALFAGVPLDRLLVSDDLVRRFVATVDNLPRRTLAERVRPVQPAAGAFATAGEGDALAIGQANAARYAPYLRLLEAADPRTLVDLYVRYYPLFDQAYRELGYPNGHFNDRLVEAIDSVLATPDVAGPVALRQPRVLYEFADPALESLPAGQKALLRLGPANAAAVKAKLVRIRALLVGEAPR